MKKAKALLGEEKREAKRPSGSGTRVSGYVDWSTPKECRRCSYFEGKNLCNNKVVARDPQVPKDEKSGLKKVDPVNGCCSWFEPED